MPLTLMSGFYQLCPKRFISIWAVILAGSSAGAYLALATSTIIPKQPNALLLFHGMLDASNSRYTVPGTKIETKSILLNFPRLYGRDETEAISEYRLLADLAADPRFALVFALHIDTLLPD